MKSVDDKRPLKVFLCHASADKPKVRELYRTLKRRGVQPWLDAEDLVPGQNWEVEIPKALLSSDAIIICLTPNSVDKEGYVQKEIKFALDKAMEMPEGRIFIIPARLEDCELPFSLKKYQAVNLYEKTGNTKLMQALKLRASQLERATVELPKKGETTAEIKKVVEEKKPPEPKEEIPETKIPKPSPEKVGVGGDVTESVIVSGSGNVINIGNQERMKDKKYEQPSRNRVLEAAIEKQVNVGVPTSLFVWIKRLESRSIVSVVSSIDEDVVLDKDNVRSKGLEIEFPIEDGQVFPVGISLRLVAHRFTPSVQQKQIIVPPDGDSEVCTFIMTPNKAGKLLLNLEVLKDQVSIVNRSIYTTAIEIEKKERSSMVLVSIPIIVFVHGETNAKKVQSEPVSVNIGGNVQGNIIIGDNNQVESKHEIEEKASHKKIETEREASQKTEDETLLRERKWSSPILTQTKKAIQLPVPSVSKVSPAKSKSATKQSRELNTTIIVALIGLAGTIIAALLSSPLIEKWLMPLPIATESATITVTLTPRPATPSQTVEPSQTPTRSFTPTVTPLPTEITDSKGVSMMLVPNGKFVMGSSDPNLYALDRDENPAHSVYLDAFYIDKYEVTNYLYKICVEAGVCAEPHYKDSNTHTQYYGVSEFDNYPVINVDWYQAKAFCEWRGARLPTEAEWEKTARGIDGRVYPWGVYEIGVTYVGSNADDTAEVGSFPSGKSVYGAYDMAGNVWEWVNDWYESNYYATLGDNAVNPQGPAEGSSKVLRGSSWLPLGYVRGQGIWNEQDERTSNRYRDFPLRFYNDVGFRCAKDAAP